MVVDAVGLLLSFAEMGMMTARLFMLVATIGRKEKWESRAGERGRVHKQVPKQVRKVEPGQKRKEGP